MDISPLSSGFGYPAPTDHDRPPPPTGAKPPLAPSADATRAGARTKRGDSDNDGAPPTKKARTEPPPPAPALAGAAARAAPDPSSDDYATYGLDFAASFPLSESETSSLRDNVGRAIRRSQSWLIDPHTAETIRGTVLDALERSPTFRAAVSYGMRRQEDLNDITYRTAYMHNPHTFEATGPVDIRTLTIEGLQSTNPQTVPIVPENEAGRDGGDASGPPYISFSAAPNAGSPYLPSWQQGLIHEIIHHVTGARDPEGSAEHQHGPTELLARRVAEEMQWPIPPSTGYGDPARIANVEAFGRAALIEAAQRNSDHERAFFERLHELSCGAAASRDFHELGHVAGNDTFSDQSSDDYADYGQIRLHPNAFGMFADSSPSGAPGGWPNAAAASGASWATQGRFFQHGKPVEGNPHVRAFGFPDGSRVIASAHEPMLTDSDGLKFGRFMTVAASAAVGGVSGFVVGGPLGAIGGAVAGIIPAATLANAYEFDRIWQGYTLDYYDAGAQTPFYTQYMYAWDSDAKRADRLSQIKDPQAWPDYANYQPDRGWDWWKWKSGNAPLRT